MKLDTKENKIERVGDLNDESSFSIALTAKAIEVLSSQIYKDAVTAILREIGTNAADSHVEAGNRDQPFDVQLPSRLSPELVIRDYGTGIPYEKVMTMYRTYFGSDKTSSNDVTGCLGLGSKSPLAYTDQFTVTSWYDGEKSVYTVYKNEEGIPCINRIFHEASDEPNGIEIRMSVSRDDHSEFREKALKVYRWFNPKPNIAGIQDDDWPNDDIIYQGDGWALRGSNSNAYSYSYTDNKKATIVMGNIGYNVTYSELYPILDKLRNNESRLLDFNPIIYVDIGDVDIAASRESLKFDGKKTLPTLKNKFAQVTKDLLKRFEQELDQQPSVWEAMKFLNILRSRKLGSILPLKVDYKGRKISDSVKLTKWEEGNITKAYASAKSYSLNRSYRRRRDHVSTATISEIYASQNLELFINDSKNHISRITHYVRNNNKNVILLEEVDKEHILSQVPKDQEKPDIYTIDQFLKEFGLDDTVRRTSELSDPPKGAAGVKAKVYHTLSPYKSDHSSTSSWSPNDINFEDGGVYVRVKGNYWIDQNGYEKDAKYLRNLRIPNIIDGSNVVGIRKKHWKEFEESDQWLTIKEHVVQEIAKRPHYRQAYIKSEAYNKLSCGIIEINMCSLISYKRDKIKPDSIFDNFINKLVSLRKYYNEPESVAYQLSLPYINDNGYSKTIDKLYKKMHNMYLKFAKTYPLIEDIGTSIDKKKMWDYIDLVDNNLSKINCEKKETPLEVELV